MDGDRSEARVPLPLHSRHGGRLGLGLAIAAKLVHAQGGRLSLAAAPGGGTTVTLDLPRAGG